MNRFIFALVAIVFVYIVCKCVVIPRLAKRKKEQEKEESTSPVTGNPFPLTAYYPFMQTPGAVTPAPVAPVKKEICFDCGVFSLNLENSESSTLSSLVNDTLLDLRQRGIDVVSVQIVPLSQRVLLCFSYVA